jgi:hypothetical protein
VTREELDARMAKSAEDVKRIREEWEKAAAAGDVKAKQCLRECFGPPAIRQLVNVPTVVVPTTLSAASSAAESAAVIPPMHWSEHELDEEG